MERERLVTCGGHGLPAGQQTGSLLITLFPCKTLVNQTLRLFPLSVLYTHFSDKIYSKSNIFMYVLIREKNFKWRLYPSTRFLQRSTVFKGSRQGWQFWKVYSKFFKFLNCGPSPHLTFKPILNFLISFLAFFYHGRLLFQVFIWSEGNFIHRQKLYHLW